MPCTGNISADFGFDCSVSVSGGIEDEILLINRSDIDIAAETFDADQVTLTNLDLLSGGKEAYLVTGYLQSNVPSWESVDRENLPDGFKHQISITIFQFTAAARKQLNEFISGANVVAVVENKSKGASNAEAFEVYGYHNGLVLESSSRNLAENSGVVNLVLATLDGEEEARVPYLWLETDYATTAAKFTSLQTPTV